jgi:hypothetical protein
MRAHWQWTLHSRMVQDRVKEEDQLGVGFALAVASAPGICCGG